MGGDLTLVDTNTCKCIRSHDGRVYVLGRPEILSQRQSSQATTQIGAATTTTTTNAFEEYFIFTLIRINNSLTHTIFKKHKILLNSITRNNNQIESKILKFILRTPQRRNYGLNYFLALLSCFWYDVEFEHNLYVYLMIPINNLAGIGDGDIPTLEFNT